MKDIESLSVKGKRILLRIDANVPLTEGAAPRIADDYRLRQVLPTLTFLLNRGARVIIAAHLGRPNGKADQSLSLKPIYLHLSALLKKPIAFAPALFSGATERAVEALEEGSILGLENVRFDKGEENNSRTFARRLSKYGEVYVNDAFSVSHREAASLVAITEFLPSYAGLLMENEVKMLGSLLRHPAKPFVAIIGGAKIEDKLPIIRTLAQKADRILLAGGVANTFRAAEGMDVKKSLVNADYFQQASEIFRLGRGRLVLPTDFVWGDERILDIGPESLTHFKRYIESGQTIFWNGSVGKAEVSQYAKGSEAIAKALAEAKATTVVGGGNTIEVLSRLKLLDKMSFVSTGGGATLEYLSGKPLPGLEALNTSN